MAKSLGNKNCRKKLEKKIASAVRGGAEAADKRHQQTTHPMLVVVSQYYQPNHSWRLSQGQQGGRGSLDGLESPCGLLTTSYKKAAVPSVAPASLLLRRRGTGAAVGQPSQAS